MDSVQKMSVAITEAAYMADIPNLSISLCQRMDDALNMNKEIEQNKLLDLEYNILEQECIKKHKYQQTRTTFFSLFTNNIMSSLILCYRFCKYNIGKSRNNW